MLSNFDLSDTRCVRCNGGSLKPIAHEPSPEGGVAPESICCVSCGAKFDDVRGLPFLGSYDQQDLVGLIEIIATAPMNAAGFSIDYIRQMDKLLKQYHLAADKAAFVRDRPEDVVKAPWFANNRYHEFLQIESILESRNIQGKRLLNVGAGIGIDSVKLLDAGAIVTCIDYSPMLVATGANSLPGARWIGGFSHVLPFQDESFDVVCANAALHHMRDVSASLKEMFRVLKPGGFMFTTGDPIRPDLSTTEHEYGVYNHHEGVLAGINENIVPFGVFYDTIAQFGDSADISLLVDVGKNERLEGGLSLGSTSFDDCWIPCTPSNIDVLRECHGGVGMVLTKNYSVNTDIPLQAATSLTAGRLYSWIGDEARAYAELMPIASPDVVDLPFPGTSQTRFELLNGWLAPSEPFQSRKGWRRARWLLTRPSLDSKLDFDIRSVSGTHRPFDVLCDGKLITTGKVNDDWTHFTVALGTDSPIGTESMGSRVLVELRLHEGAGHGDSFSDQLFEVRNRLLS